MSPSPPLPFGFNLIGYASSNLGLGNTLRQYAESFLKNGEKKIAIYDIDSGINRSNFDNSLSGYFISSANELPYAINLFIIGAHILPNFVLRPPMGLNFEDRLNVAFIWWELPDFPQHLIDAAKLFDVLITGSDFVYSTLSNNVPGIPILNAEHPVSIPETIINTRKYFGIPEDKFAIFTGFDPFSSIDRKNPYAPIDAFKQAFLNRDDCCLVIKLNYSTTTKEIDTLLANLYNHIDNDPRIYIIKQSIPYKDLINLYSSCDAFISLHRSEGLGLMPLEAMRLGKPVIATAWSGNMSYMNYNNSCLVQSDLIPINPDAQNYGSNTLGITSKWADPNISQAAAWLAKLADDSDFRLKISLAAKKDSLKYHEKACIALFADEIKSIWESRKLLPKKNRNNLLIVARKSNIEFNRRLELKKSNILQKLTIITKEILGKYIMWRLNKLKL